MDGFFANGRVVDLIVIFMLIEAVVLVSYRRLTGHELNTLEIVVVLLPGLCLLLALKSALTQEPWPWILAWLGAALVMHLADLWQRQRRR